MYETDAPPQVRHGIWPSVPFPGSVCAGSTSGMLLVVVAGLVCPAISLGSIVLLLFLAKTSWLAAGECDAAIHRGAAPFTARASRDADRVGDAMNHVAESDL